MTMIRTALSVLIPLSLFIACGDGESDNSQLTITGEGDGDTSMGGASNPTNGGAGGEENQTNSGAGDGDGDSQGGGSRSSTGDGDGSNNEPEPSEFCQGAIDYDEVRDFEDTPRILFEGNAYRCTDASDCQMHEPLTMIDYKDYYTYLGPCGEVDTCAEDEAWQEGTEYDMNDVVVHEGRSYRCFAPSACETDEPGTTWDAWSKEESCVASCFNGIQDGDETCVDGGGDDCSAQCSDGERCSEDDDCAGGSCRGSRCEIPHCGNGTTDGNESDLDCGGDCGTCPLGDSCNADGECATGNCDGGVCAAHSSCVAGYQSDACLNEGAECSNQGSGVGTGCRNMLQCWIDNDCGPAGCSQSASDTCGINNIENGSQDVLSAAWNVYSCMCD